MGEGKVVGALSLLPPPPARARHSFPPASPDGARSAAVAVAAAPPGAGGGGTSPAASCPLLPASLPSPRALPVPSPSPARLRRLYPPTPPAVTLGDSALGTFAALAPAHARPSDADPGVGSRWAGAEAAAAGARARPRPRPLPAAPSAEPGGRPIHSAAGRNQVGAREGAAPANPAPGGGRGREGGKRGWREGGRGRRLGPALQLPRELGRFAI